MTKVSGFLSQDVEVERKETPDSLMDTTKIPPAWIPKLEKLMSWYDRQIYPVWSPFRTRQTRSHKAKSKSNSYLPMIRDLWHALSDADQEAWAEAADFVQRTGYQLFVKDTSYRYKNGYAFPGIPSDKHQLQSLRIANPGGSEEVYLQRDDVNLTGEVTLSFNYKKDEHSPTAGEPFTIQVKLWYFEDGENKTEEYEWTIGSGDVDWTTFSQTYGEDGRMYFHHRVKMILDNYDCEVFLANFLLQDETLAWTVEYEANVLPPDDAQPWSRVGSVSTEKIIGSRLFLEEEEGCTDAISYVRTPSFDNAVGSSVKFRMKLPSGTEKDSGDDNYTARVIHGDANHQVEYLLFQNGIILKDGDTYTKYHYNLRDVHTYTSYLRASRLYFYVARSLAFRKDLSGGGGQKVAFGHSGREDNETKTIWSYVNYFQGKDAAPGEDIVREGWWINSGDSWEPQELYRKQGWYFSHGYSVPYFDVVYLV